MDVDMKARLALLEDAMVRLTAHLMSIEVRSANEAERIGTDMRDALSAKRLDFIGRYVAAGELDAFMSALLTHQEQMWCDVMERWRKTVTPPTP